MSYTVDYYDSLVTSEHAQAPKFIATLEAITSPIVTVQELLESMIPDFDLDTAMGAQLDVVGQWVGISRYLNAPLVGVYFEWDSDNPAVEWDAGVWQGLFDPDSGLIALPDDLYRILIKIKIAANSWDGSIPGAYAAFTFAFPTGVFILLIDNQDMSMDVAIFGINSAWVTSALMQQQYFPFRPEGVRIREYIYTPDGGPLFFWDVENTDTTAGWDVGEWGVVIA
jgi:hypothetical protein